MVITHINIQASMHKGEDQLACAIVTIPVEDIHLVRSCDLIDACQRSVAHCVEELQKVLDSG